MTTFSHLKLLIKFNIWSNQGNDNLIHPFHLHFFRDQFVTTLQYKQHKTLQFLSAFIKICNVRYFRLRHFVIWLMLYYIVKVVSIRE